MLRKILEHPEARGMDLDDPSTTNLRAGIIKRKAFLRKIYESWYTFFENNLPKGPAQILEIGAGGGFFRERVPNAVTSDIFVIKGIDAALDAVHLPFRGESLDGIVMVNTLHHIPDAAAFLSEAARTLRPGGIIAMVEPWVTPWSRFVYTRLHHEPFDPEAEQWRFETSGPLSSANGALPWIIFGRDAAKFENAYRSLRVERIDPFMPFSYLVSGGVSMRALMPGWSFGAWRALDRMFSHQGIFAKIIVRKE